MSMLCFNKTLFAKPDSGLELVHCAVVCQLLLQALLEEKVT